MDLVRAVLHLKNEISQVPPDGYILVVKVGEGSAPGFHGILWRMGIALLGTWCPSWEGVVSVGEQFPHFWVIRWVIGSMVGAIPAFPAPPLNPWSNPSIPCSCFSAIPAFPAPPLDPWSNPSIPSSSTGSLDQQLENFHHSPLPNGILPSAIQTIPTGNSTGSIPRSIPKFLPGSITGSLPGSIPKFLLGSIPGSIPGCIPTLPSHRTSAFPYGSSSGASTRSSPTFHPLPAPR